MIDESQQLRLLHSLRGEERHVENCLPDVIVNLFASPHRGGGIHMDAAFSEVAGLRCRSIRTSSGFIASIEPLEDYVNLHWVRSGHVVFDAGQRSTAFSAGAAFVWNSAAVRQIDHTSDLDLIVTTIRQSDIKAFAKALTGREHEDRVDFLAVPPDSPNENGLRFVMATMAGAILDDTPLARAPLASAALKDMVLGALIELCPNNIRLPPFAGASEPRAVARAKEFMQANLGRPLRVAEIAEASGISLRGLQIAFRRATGRSLVEYLRMLRLERARIDLTDPISSPFISEVAYRWGFNNLSDFARRYQEAFGERPCDTRRRVRREQGVKAARHARPRFS